MVLLYMVTWIPLIYPSHVNIYTSTMDPSWVIDGIGSAWITYMDPITSITLLEDHQQQCFLPTNMGLFFWNLVGFNRGYLEEYPIAQ